MINRFTQQMIILASEIESGLENVHKQEPDWEQIEKALWKLRKQWEMINFLQEHQKEEMRLQIDLKYDVFDFSPKELEGQWEAFHDYKEFQIGFWYDEVEITLFDKVTQKLYVFQHNDYTWEEEKEIIETIDKAIKAFEYQQKHQLTLF